MPNDAMFQLFFFVLAFSDGSFKIERWPTLELCQQQARAREFIFRGGGYLALSPIGVSECAQEQEVTEDRQHEQPPAAVALSMAPVPVT